MMDFRGFDIYGADQRGLEYIITYFLQDIPDSHIRKGQTCVEIETDVSVPDCVAQGLAPDCVKLTLKKDDNNIIYSLYAQWVISTIPFGVIKHNVESEGSSLFPSASVEWKAIVPKFIMGGYHSSYLRFSEKFWQDTEFILTAAEPEYEQPNNNENIDNPVIGFKPHDTVSCKSISLKCHTVPFLVLTFFVSTGPPEQVLARFQYYASQRRGRCR